MKRDSLKLFRTIETLYSIRDLDSLLERVLTEARQFVNADAGTIYLAARGYLYFSFVQNDTLFRGETKDKYIPSGAALAIDKSSLAGYVAKTGETILIDDVYHIQSSVSYTFNPAFDQKTSYRTASILCVPLKTRDNEIVGVLQLINAKNEKGEVVAFSVQDELFISQFALNAADAIEKARLSREMVLRMVELAELRDPYETSQHAKRVGAYAVELYEKWAHRRGISPREIRKVRDVLRTAAILHDVGKIAVSDIILKKPGGLTYDETLIMREHTVRGARLFTPHHLILGLHVRGGGAQPPRELGWHGVPRPHRQHLRAQDLHGAGQAGHGDSPFRAGSHHRGRLRRPCLAAGLQEGLAAGARASLHALPGRQEVRSRAGEHLPEDGRAAGGHRKEVRLLERCALPSVLNGERR